MINSFWQVFDSSLFPVLTLEVAPQPKASHARKNSFHRSFLVPVPRVSLMRSNVSRSKYSAPPPPMSLCAKAL